MAASLSPTKGNLMAVKKQWALANVGYELMDRKRNVIIREMMALIDRAGIIQGQIDDAYAQAYAALQRAQVAHGVCADVAATIPLENGLSLKLRSVMGVELPLVRLDPAPIELSYGFQFTSSLLDEAYIWFNKVKKLTVELAEVENSIYRLATAVSKVQKRANALKNIILPRLAESSTVISAALEEKEREDFSRLKVIKTQKNASRKENT